MFHAFILLLQSLFCQGANCTEQQYEKAIHMQMNELQAVHQNATASYNEANGTVTVSCPNGSIIVIDPSEQD
jgi:hypothetical protein